MGDTQAAMRGTVRMTIRETMRDTRPKTIVMGDPRDTVCDDVGCGGRGSICDTIQESSRETMQNTMQNTMRGYQAGDHTGDLMGGLITYGAICETTRDHADDHARDRG
eukprot:4134661-Pyramimonas_sp.AAC.1